jgi:hypothetical protein
VAKPSDGSVSPLEDHAAFLLGLVAEQPDLTLDEIAVAMASVSREWPAGSSAMQDDIMGCVQCSARGSAQLSMQATGFHHLARFPPKPMLCGRIAFR